MFKAFKQKLEELGLRDHFKNVKFSPLLSQLKIF